MRVRQPHLGALLLICATVAAGCSGGGESAPDSVEILVPNWPQVADPIEARIDADFERELGVDITIVRVGDNNYAGVDERVQNDLIAGNPPDIIVTGLNSIRAYADAEASTVLNDAIDSDEEFDAGEYYPALLELGEFGSDVHGLPFGVSTYTLYYNRDAFEAAGLDPDSPPATFSELKADAETIVGSGAARTGIAIRSDHVATYGFGNFIQSAGGSLMNDDESEVTFNSPEGKKIIQFWADLIETRAGAAYSSEQIGDVFLRGDAAMMLQSSSYTASLQSGVSFEVGSAPFPIPDGGTRRAMAGGAAFVSFAESADETDLHWKVIKYLIDPEAVAEMVRASGFAPISRTAAEDPDLLGTYLEENPLAKAGWDQLESLAPWYQFPGPNNVEIADVMVDQVGSALAGESPVDEALDLAAERTTELIP